MPPVDLDHLRALRSGVSWSDTTAKEWDRMLGECFDELEALRAEVERLKQHRGCPCQKCQNNGAGKERAAIVAWLRVNGTGHLADCIKLCRHHAD